MIYRSLLISGFIILLLFSPATRGEAAKMNQFSLESSAFSNNGNIPKLYTCDGKDINPPLTIRNVPAGAKSLVLIVDDPDAPAGTWVHWVMWNIDTSTKDIAENSVPSGAMQGRNDFKKTSYGGPCPPSGTHRYFFKAYALDTPLNLKDNATKQDVEKAMKGHVVAEAQVIGLYKRQ